MTRTVSTPNGRALPPPCSRSGDSPNSAGIAPQLLRMGNTASSRVQLPTPADPPTRSAGPPGIWRSGVVKPIRQTVRITGAFLQDQRSGQAGQLRKISDRIGAAWSEGFWRGLGFSAVGVAPSRSYLGSRTRFTNDVTAAHLPTYERGMRLTRSGPVRLVDGPCVSAAIGSRKCRKLQWLRAA